MTNYELRVFNCVERSHFFLQRTEVLPLTAKETSFATPLATAYSDLKAHLVDQGTGNRGYREGTAERFAMVGEIWRMNRRIADIAKSIAEEGVDPGMAEKFRLPRLSRTQLVVAGTGLGFAAAAEPIAALFTERGMEATFVEDLRALVAAYESASGVRASGLTEQTTGTAGLAQIAQQGLRYVRLLRPLIKERLKSNLPLQAAWVLASRVARRGTVELPATPPPAPAPAPPSGGS